MGMGGGMGGGGFTQFSSSSFSTGGPSQSIQTKTYIENGKRVTRTEKTMIDH